MTKKMITSLVLSSVIAALLFSACAAAPATTNTTGKIEQGVRVIDIAKGFSEKPIEVYRGEELNIRYTGTQDGVSLNVPSYDISETSDGKIVVAYIKVKEEGEFELIAKEYGETEIGVIDVELYENVAVFKNASAKEFEQALEGEYFLLDVRTQDEYDEVHIKGATVISVYELESRLDEIEQYKDANVLVYCRSGNRSIVASQILIGEGFKNVTNLNGGISAWLAYQQTK